MRGAQELIWNDGTRMPKWVWHKKDRFMHKRMCTCTKKCAKPIVVGQLDQIESQPRCSFRKRFTTTRAKRGEFMALARCCGGKYVAGAGKNWLAVPLFIFPYPICEHRNDLKQVAYEGHVGGRDNGRFPVGIYGNDVFRLRHPGQMLNGS